MVSKFSRKRDLGYEDADDKLHAVMMQPLKSGHVTIDLTEKPTEIPWNQAVKQSWNALLEIPSRVTHTDDSAFWSENVDSSSTEFYIPLNVHFIGVLNRVCDDTSRLQQLAQQVSELRNRIRCGTHGTIEARGKGWTGVGIDSSGRSKECGMALQWRPQRTKGEVQSACSLVGVPALRVSHELRDQEDRSWTDEGNGPRAEHYSVGTDRVGEGPGSTKHDRSHGQRKGHGDQREDASDGDPNQHLFDSDVSRVCQEIGALGQSGSTGPNTKSDGGTKAKGNTEVDGGGSTITTNGGGVGARDQEGLGAGDCGHELRKGIFKADDEDGESPTPGPGRCDEYQLISGRRRSWQGLWRALSDLRGRMMSASHSEIGGAMVDAADAESGLSSGKTLKQDPEGQQSMHDGIIPPKPVGSKDHQDEVIHSQVTRQEHNVGATDTRGALGSSPHVLDRCCVEDSRPPDVCNSNMDVGSAVLTPEPDEADQEDGEKVPLDRHGLKDDQSPMFNLRNGKFNQQSKKNVITPNLAKRLATRAAVIGAMMLAPTRGLLSQVSGHPDFMEVACAPESSLSAEMMKQGYSIKRINYREGYDLESKRGTSMLRQEMTLNTPRMAWISLPCTRLSPLVNLTQRTPDEWATFEKKQQADLRRADEVSDGICIGLEQGMDFAWEWPTNPSKGWKSRAITKLLKKLRQLGRPVFWARFHGCAYGLEYNGLPIQKSWTVLTSCRQIWMGLSHRCPGHSEHLQCRGKVAQFSAYYPPKMVTAVVKAIIASWNEGEDKQEVSIADDVQQYLLQCPCNGNMDEPTHQLRDEEPAVMALTRNRFPKEPPSGKRLEAIRQSMLRIHRASGHTSMQNLEKMLRARQAPTWVLDLARNLQCPDCVEARKPRPPPPSSLESSPGLFEQLGTDVFEVEVPQQQFEETIHRKVKFILWRDRASGLAMVDCLQRYGEPEVRHWNPTTSDIIKSFNQWLMHNPAPKWVISDPATYFTSEQWLDHLGRSGVGCLTSPAEAHWVLGAEEGCIQILKSTANRIMKESSYGMDIVDAMTLAAHGHNQSIGSNGFSPFQWTRGSSAPEPDLPIGLDPSKAFGGMLKLKARAKIAYEMESAKVRLSKLNNTVARPSASFKTGALVMVWRQRVRPGKVSGQWIGPLRVLLQENHTLWLATGATLIKARTNQVRSVTRREELQASLEGTAILRLPVTLESLMREFSGKHFTNITGEVPSEAQQQADLEATTVQIPPQSKFRADSWKIEGQWLIRIHSAPRLALFTPDRVQACPVPDDELTGLRQTTVKPIAIGAETVMIEDQFRDESDPHRLLQERWTGETRFKLKEKNVRRTVRAPSRGKKRKEVEDPEVDPGAPIEKKDGETVEGEVFPPVPDSELNQALQDLGPNIVDGVPSSSLGSGGQAAVGNQCVVADCTQPGGHYGPHVDAQGRRFTWNTYDGRMELEETDSESSSSSEELIPEMENEKTRRDRSRSPLRDDHKKMCFLYLSWI